MPASIVTMNYLKFDSLYTESGWIDEAYVCLNAKNELIKISTQKPFAGKVESISGWGLPGFINSHSHAFQYAMSGRAEQLSPLANNDNFWSWRQAMYEIALHITPEQMETIATQLYRQMRLHGYTHVIEFHYLHHTPRGTPYDNIAEMSIRLLRAAEHADIGITLLPVLYQRCDLKTKHTPQQKRFIIPHLEDYWKLLSACETACKQYPRANVGAAIHSMRAVAPEVIQAFCHDVDKKLPIHMHIAEQIAEVHQCQQILGKRPVEWLIDNLDLNEHFNLIHATHMNSEETRDLAQSQAQVILCPSTEGNLGDGIFPFIEYLEHGGRYGIGSDSHIGLSPMEELRWLDYGQRLLKQQRNVVCLNQPGNSGELLFKQSLNGGAKAAGQYTEQPLWPVGSYFDFITLDAHHPRFESVSKEHRLATLIYCGEPGMIQPAVRSSLAESTVS